MIVVVYAPDPKDPTSGRITSCRVAPEAVLKDVPHVEVGEHRDNWDATHCVLKGKVVERADLTEVEALETQLSWSRVKVKRQHFLTGSDWTQLPSNHLTDEQMAEWEERRQAARDLTAFDCPHQAMKVLIALEG